MNRDGMSEEEFDKGIQHWVERGYMRIERDPKHPNDKHMDHIILTDKLEGEKMKVMEAMLKVPDVETRGITIEELQQATGVEPDIIRIIIGGMNAHGLIKKID